MHKKMPTSTLERAQDLVYAAWEVPTAQRRVGLAKQALALSPRCADACVLLTLRAHIPAPGKPVRTPRKSRKKNTPG